MRPACGSSKLRQLRDRTQETVDLYRQSAVAIAGQLDTLNQRLALLQARARLGAVDEAAELDADPRARALREFVVRTGRDSVRLANEASAIEPRSESDSLRKRQLELRADEAFLRSNLRAADIDLLGIEKQLAYLQGIAATERGILPRRLATEGLAAVRPGRRPAGRAHDGHRRPAPQPRRSALAAAPADAGHGAGRSAPCAT